MRRSKTSPAHVSPFGFLALRGSALALRCLAAAPFSAAAVLSALATTTVAVEAAAQDDDKKSKGGGGSMDTGDPVDTERSDDGPYKPKGKTGEAAEKQEEKVEVEEVVKAKPRDKIVAFGEALIGFGKAPPPPNAGDLNGTGDGTGVTLQVGGRYVLNPKMSLGVRVPWTTATIESTETGIDQSSTAFGSPLLFLEYRVGLTPLTTLPIFFGVGVPVAQGNPDRWGTDDSGKPAAETNMLADAASGWKDGELFMPKRLPLVLGIGIRNERKAVELEAKTKIAVLVNIGGEISNPGGALTETVGQDSGTLKIPAVALRNVTTAGVKWEFLPKPALFVGLDGSLVFYPLPAVDYEPVTNPTGPSPFQVVFEPRVGAKFGKITPTASYVLPIGGQLADAGVGGVRLHVDVAF